MSGFSAGVAKKEEEIVRLKKALEATKDLMELLDLPHVKVMVMGSSITVDRNRADIGQALGQVRAALAELGEAAQ